MAVKDYYFTFGVNDEVRVHIRAISKLIAKEKMRTGFGDFWIHSYPEEAAETT